MNNSAMLNRKKRKNHVFNNYGSGVIMAYDKIQLERITATRRTIAHTQWFISSPWGCEIFDGDEDEVKARLKRIKSCNNILKRTSRRRQLV